MFLPFHAKSAPPTSSTLLDSLGIHLVLFGLGELEGRMVVWRPGFPGHWETPPAIVL